MIRCVLRKRPPDGAVVALLCFLNCVVITCCAPHDNMRRPRQQATDYGDHTVRINIRPYSQHEPRNHRMNSEISTSRGIYTGSKSGPLQQRHVISSMSDSMDNAISLQRSTSGERSSVQSRLPPGEKVAHSDTVLSDDTREGKLKHGGRDLHLTIMSSSSSHSTMPVAAGPISVPVDEFYSKLQSVNTVYDLLRIFYPEHNSYESQVVVPLEDKMLQDMPSSQNFMLSSQRKYQSPSHKKRHKKGNESIRRRKRNKRNKKKSKRGITSVPTSLGSSQVNGDISNLT